MPQSLANILIHIIWSTKERRPLISDAVRPGLHGYMAGILKNLAGHHRKRDFRDEFREFCLKYNVPLDERYVWD